MFFFKEGLKGLLKIKIFLLFLEIVFIIYLRVVVLLVLFGLIRVNILFFWIEKFILDKICLLFIFLFKFLIFIVIILVFIIFFNICKVC